MVDSDQESDGGSPLVEQLAEGYLSRLRNGEHPRISEYTQEYPEVADEIRDVFSTLAMLEDFAPDAHDNVDDALPEFLDVPKQLGEYRIIRELGRGGMGVVYEAEHSIMRRRVALKVLYPAAAAKQQDVGRFLREARAAGRLHHTNIVPVFEVGSDKGMHFYAMQCIRGQNLDFVIHDLKRLRESSNAIDLKNDPGNQSGSFNAAASLITGNFDVAAEADDDAAEPNTSMAPVDTDSQPTEIEVPDDSELSQVGETHDVYFQRISKVILAVADALSYAHQQGILHRDIKPSNLILDTTGTVWVTDFGLAHSEGEELTRTGDIVGTLRYMAPERFRGQGDERSDVYSLGLTLYELSTLRHAFDQADRGDLIRNVMRIEPPRPSRVNKKIPRDLETIILKSIAREPAARYPTATEFANDLRLFLADRPIQARRSSFIEQSWRWCRRNPYVTSLIACIVALLFIISGGAIQFGLRTERQNQALLAEREQSKSYLYEAHFNRAQAERRNRLTGRRDENIVALTKAAILLPSLNLTHQERKRERLRLRNETIAMFSQTDFLINDSLSSSTALPRPRVFRPDFQQYVVSGGHVEIRASDDHRTIKKLPPFDTKATHIQYSPDGKHLVLMHAQPSTTRPLMRIWDIESEESAMLVHTLGTFVRTSTTGLFATWSGSQVMIHDLDQEKAARNREFEFNIRDLVFSPRGNQIAIVGDANELVIWSLDKDEIDRRELPNRSASIDWCSATDRQIIGTQKGTLLILDADQPDSEVITLRGHGDSIHRVCVGDNGALAASAAWDGTVRIWDLRRLKEIKRFANMRNVIGFSRDSKFLACDSVNGQTGVFEVVDDGPRSPFYKRDLSRRNDVAFHPKFPWLVVVATSFHSEFWDLRRKELHGMLETERTFSLRFNEDGSQLLTSGRRGLRQWTIATTNDGQWAADFATDGKFLVLGDTYWMAASDDLNRVAYVDVSKKVYVLDQQKSGSTIEVPGIDDAHLPAMSPDGKWLIVTREKDRRLNVLNAKTGALVTELPETRLPEWWASALTASGSPPIVTTNASYGVHRIGKFSTNKTVQRAFPGKSRFHPMENGLR